MVRDIPFLFSSELILFEWSQQTINKKETKAYDLSLPETLKKPFNLVGTINCSIMVSYIYIYIYKPNSKCST